MNKIFQNIKLEISVKSRLDATKKDTSYSDYVDAMLRYFEITNIEPRSWKVYPGLQTQKDLERVIKIIKAIEKDFIKPTYEIVKGNKHVHLPVQEPPEGNSPSPSMPLDEVQALIDKYTELSEVMERKDEELSQLRKENETLKGKIGQEQQQVSGESINKEAILQALESIESAMVKSVHSIDLRINPKTFNSYKERIISELNVCQGT